MFWRDQTMLEVICHSKTTLRNVPKISGTSRKSCFELKIIFFGMGLDIPGADSIRLFSGGPSKKKLKILIFVDFIAVFRSETAVFFKCRRSSRPERQRGSWALTRRGKYHVFTCGACRRRAEQRHERSEVAGDRSIYIYKYMIVFKCTFFGPPPPFFSR